MAENNDPKFCHFHMGISHAALSSKSHYTVVNVDYGDW